MLHCPKCGKEYPAGMLICPADNSRLLADVTLVGEGATDPLIGQTLDGKYRIEARLGVGGIGTVYRARHLLIDRAVAIKVLNPRFGEDEAARERFRREAKAAGRLQHENAVTVTDFAETSTGYLYIVMELLEGRTLRDVIARDAPLDTARATSIMLQASAAVGAAHEAGIIHRDLKPANIFIRHRADVPSVVKVLDFGIAKLAAEFLDDEDPQTLTQVGAMIGTPRYMSPEQCGGMNLTAAADVYSLGVILYEMLTGIVPFSGSTPLSIAVKHASEAPQRPRSIVASIPAALEQVVLHALEKNPSDRPADANAFRRELFETAERLGFEHAAVTSAPDLKTLKDVATESPSGRLIVDISRLRESRALTSSGTDLTVVRQDSSIEVDQSAGQTAGEISRVVVPLTKPARYVGKPIVALIIVISVLVIIGFALFAFRSWRALPAAIEVDAATPSPTAVPSPEPSPSPSASPSPKREAPKPKPDNANKKKAEKDNSLMDKFKRIFKKRS